MANWIIRSTFNFLIVILILIRLHFFIETSQQNAFNLKRLKIDWFFHLIKMNKYFFAFYEENHENFYENDVPNSSGGQKQKKRETAGYWFRSHLWWVRIDFFIVSRFFMHFISIDFAMLLLIYLLLNDTFISANMEKNLVFLLQEKFQRGTHCSVTEISRHR